ncbi:hypothetical protein HMSSN036_44970 [Paenibacillus macerans]|nr:hypothetical protein HMSSN036_44970 [Paenibacillus macerans]
MFHHITVLKAEATEGLRIKPDGIYVDCTLGGGGHSSVILSQLGEGGRLIAFDQDDWALDNAKERLAPYADKLTLVKSNFRHLEQKLLELSGIPQQNGVPQVDGVLFDLGVSSPQFDEGERGFSYNADAPSICAWINRRGSQRGTSSTSGRSGKLPAFCSSTGRRSFPDASPKLSWRGANRSR